MHTYFISFLAEVIHTPESEIKKFLKFFNKVTTSFFKGFMLKEIFFNVTLIINTFLSKSIKKALYKPYKVVMYR